MPDKLTLHFGAMCDPLAKQLSEQKFKFDKEDVKLFQLLADSIVTLYIHGIVPKKQHSELQMKLSDKIRKHVEKQNPQAKPLNKIK